MNIGIAYDLKEDYLKMGFSKEESAEFDRIETIEAIEQALQADSHKTERIGHVKSLAKMLVEGKKWDIVFNITEGMYGIGREAQVPALLDAYNIPYTFSDTLVSALTLHKGYTKSVIRDLGIPTADFAVVETISDIKKIGLPYPLFAKPVAEGTGKGINAASKIKSSSELEQVCRELLEKFNQPVIVETYLPGREFTVGLWGTGADAEAIGTLEIVITDRGEKEVYSYENKIYCHENIDYVYVDDKDARNCMDVALAAWKGLGCRDAGRIDLRLDADGVPNFMEVNPLAGLNPIDSDLPILCSRMGIPYNTLIKKIMDSAAKRIDARKK